ncbi:MAG: hypothetical protein ACJ74U_02930 [Jatrophihabitantaceae bacterium]
MAFGVRRLLGVLSAAVLLTAVAGSVYATLLRPATGQESPGSRASCATPAGPIDFWQDQAANLAAGNAIGRFPDELFRQPGYAEIQVVPCGIEINVVGKPTAVELAIARDAPQYQGRDIPVRFRSVRYSERDLKATMRMIEADAADWSKRGIQLSFVGINAHDRVEISLAHYKPVYRTVLRLRYGDRIVVHPQDLQFWNQ